MRISDWSSDVCSSDLRGHMPSIYANAPEDYEEEKRIFYVAISRSMKHLTFYRPAYDAKGNFTSPSAYEREIQPYVAYVRFMPRIPVSSGGPTQTNNRIYMTSKLTKTAISSPKCEAFTPESTGRGPVREREGK